ncbi:GTPase [Pseudarthrobacter sp. J1763]|uniref:GTPase n=1 Tax=Pseudarthrobacter sp. J1763 TaxID=3420445 RepID=UPI003D2C5DCA
MSRHSVAKESSALQRRLEGLNAARELAGGVLPDATLDSTLALLERASSRRSMSADHTVVGFFGATGSGKSSLFNAVNGAEIATAAARRPTTSEPLASVWGVEGSEPLLDWLQVNKRHHAQAVDGFADESTGLILLDLPDFDSTSAANRAVVERMVGLVDVLVWVLDPQKYADAAVHNEFLTPMASHGAVTLVVLNQIDKLPAAEVPHVLESLQGILKRDGLGTVKVLGASALTGAGVDKVRASIRQVVQAREAISQRLSADVARAADELAGAAGEGDAAGIKAGIVDRLTEQLATAANVHVVVDAVARSYKRESTARTGWPVTRWMIGLRADPLRRLNLRRVGAAADTNRTSLPKASAAERARTDSAVRDFADAASEGAPGPWRNAIRGAAREGREKLPGALDHAIASTDLKAERKSWWWGIFNVLQWLALLTAVGGLGWLGVLAVLGYLQMPVPEVPRVEGWPYPTLMIAGGVALGILLAMLGKVFAAGAARARAASARKKLAASIRAVAQREIVEPVDLEVNRLKSFNKALKTARGR